MKDTETFIPQSDRTFYEARQYPELDPGQKTRILQQFKQILDSGELTPVEEEAIGEEDNTPVS